jgi:hypothetical protein
MDLLCWLSLADCSLTQPAAHVERAAPEITGDALTRAVAVVIGAILIEERRPRRLW